MNRSTFLAVAAAASLAACSDNSTAPETALGGVSFAEGTSSEQRYVVLGANSALPADFASRVSAAGGTLLNQHGAIGVAVVIGGSGVASALRAVPGIESVARDITYRQPTPRKVFDFVEASLLEDGLSSETGGNPGTNPFYFIQWAHGSLGTPTAWTAGYKGAGVRVAILDGGIYTAHQDLTGKVDLAASRSFACASPPPAACVITPFNSDVGTFWHGTHVAGIVGASDNNVGVIGVAPDATLIGVKVLHSGSGEFSWLIDAIMYAAKPLAEGGAGAQVINMSLGALIDMADPENLKADVLELDKAISRATSYAWDRGVTVVASAGNESTLLGKDVLHYPSMSQKIISVAATAPEGWALGATNYSDPASYTNYGKKGVDLAAPGGDARLPGNAVCTRTGAISITHFCWVFDLYLSTSRGTATTGGYSWAAGTSMASPAVAGVAALIIGKASGNISPAEVKARLQQGAIDLGKPGNDEVYGAGYVNAVNSLSL